MTEIKDNEIQQKVENMIDHVKFCYDKSNQLKIIEFIQNYPYESILIFTAGERKGFKDCKKMTDDILGGC